MAATMGRLKLHMLFMYAAAELKICFYHPKGQGKGYSFKLQEGIWAAYKIKCFCFNRAIQQLEPVIQRDRGTNYKIYF